MLRKKTWNLFDAGNIFQQRLVTIFSFSQEEIYVIYVQLGFVLIQVGQSVLSVLCFKLFYQDRVSGRRQKLGVQVNE